MKRILFICDPADIHDNKWMSFFSMMKDKYLVYAIGEKGSEYNQSIKCRLEGVNIKLLPPIDSFSIKSPFRTILTIIKINIFIEKYKIDLVHFLFATPYSIWGNFIFCRHAITTRGSDVLKVIPSLILNSSFKSFYLKIIYFLLKRSFRNATFITSTSQAQKEKIFELFQLSNVYIIRTGVNVDEIISYNKPELVKEIGINKQFVFSPRFMCPIYNIDYIIDAIELLPKKMLDNYLFVFIKGKNFDVDYCDKIICRLDHLQKNSNLNYKVYDYLNQETMWMLYKNATLTISTPISDGTPNSALESMAAGCPLILSKLEYDKDLFEDTYNEVPLGEAFVFAQVIESTLENPNIIKVNNAKRNVKLFGNRIVEMKKLDKLYKNV